MSGQEVDSLARLEERIRQAAELVSSLRRERDAAVHEATEARAELDTLRRERVAVRTRIEKLLGQMDVLNAG